MARRAQETERPGRRRRVSNSKGTAGDARRAASSARKAGESGVASARSAGASAASGAREAADTATDAATGQAATAMAASEIAEGAMDATRHVATTALDAAKETLTAGKAAGQEGLLRQVFLAAREAAGEVLEDEARAAARQAAEVLTARAPEIAREQLEKRGGSNAAAKAAVEFGRAKLQGAGGTKALTSAAVGAIKESAGGLRTKVTDTIGGQGEEDEEGGTSRLPVDVSFDIGVPRSVVWDEWTQFENSPPSLHRIQESEDGTLKVSSKVWGTTREEEVEIIEQVAEERLAWRAQGALPYRGVASFHELDENLTRLLVTLEFEPQGLLARLGMRARLIERGVEADVKRFKADLETGRDDEDEDGHQPEEGDDDGQLGVDEEPELEADDFEEPDSDEPEEEPEEELPEADVEGAEDETDESEEGPEEEEAVPAPAPRRQPARGSTSRRSGARQSSERGSSGGGRSASSSRAKSSGAGAASSTRAKSGSRQASSSSARTSARKGQSGQSKSPSRSGSSRQRSTSRKG